MTEALVTLTELADRLPFVMDDDDSREATGALDDLSDDARHYGKAAWVSPTVSPQVVKNMVLRAAVRHMKNYEGYTTSRAGDETLTWTDRKHEAGSAYFTDREIKNLRTMAGVAVIVSVPITAWGPMDPDATGYVPVEDGTKVFPLFAQDYS